MKARRIAANIAKLPELIRQTRSVITPLNPRRRMRTRWRLVLRIRLTIAAEPDRGQYRQAAGVAKPLSDRIRLPLSAPAEQTQRAEAGGEDIYKNL